MRPARDRGRRQRSQRASVGRREPGRRAGARARGRAHVRGRRSTTSACGATATSRGRRATRCRAARRRRGPVARAGLDPVRAGDAPRRPRRHRAGRAPQRDRWPCCGAAATSSMLVGFIGGDEHDGTLRLRTDRTLRAEAFLGGAVLAPGRAPRPPRRRRACGRRRSTTCSRPGLPMSARHPARAPTAPRTVGWCSWYHYFHDVTEADIRANLAIADRDGWPFDVFQVDDGYQSAIGDWLTTNDKFPSGVEALAADIARTGRTPGIWLAPFLVHPDSDGRPRAPRLDRPVHRRRARARRLGQRAVGRRDAHARHDEPRRARAPRGHGARARRAGVALPEARLHLRAELRRRLGRPVTHARAAGASRLRRDPPGRGRRRVHPRLRRAARLHRRRRRRHAHRPRRRAALGSRSPTRGTRPATSARSRRSATRSANVLHRGSCTGGCGSTTPTA